MGFGDDYPMDQGVAEEPLIMPLPIISPEELLLLREQAEEAVTLREALRVSLLDVQTITVERDAALTRELNWEAQAQQSAAELVELATQRDVSVNNEVETQRRFEESHLSLEARTRENADLIVLNQAITNQRDDASSEKASITQELLETRTSLEAQTQQFSTMAEQMELVTVRERDLTLEKDAAVAHGVSLEEQIGPLQKKIKELQEVIDTIPKLQEALKSVRAQVTPLQEQLKHSATRIKSLEQTLLSKQTERKRLWKELGIKERAIAEIRDACNLKVEKQVNDALTSHSQGWSNTLMDGLNALHVSSDDLTKKFSQACHAALEDGCLAGVFNYLQQLLNYIESEREEKVAFLEQQIKDNAKNSEAFSQTLSTELKDANTSASHLKASCRTLQEKLDAAVTQIQEKQSDVASLSSKVSVLTDGIREKSLAFVECNGQLFLAREQINRLQASLAEYQATSTRTKEQAALELQDFMSKLDLEQKASANQEVTIRTLRSRMNQMTEQYQLSEGKLLEMKKECAHWKDEVSNLTRDKRTIESQLGQANSNSSDLIAQVHALTMNYHALQAKLEYTTKEFDTVALELVEKEKQGTLLASQMAQSEQRFLTTCRDLNEHLKSDKKHISVQDKTIAQLTNDVHKQEQTLHESNSRLSQYEQAVSRLTSDLEKRDVNLGAKDALVARLENALHGANQSLSASQASLKEKDDEIAALKSLLDAQDAMKPHEPKGKSSRFGMMNLRGCAWYWWTTLPSALIPLVTGLSIQPRI